MTAALGGDFRHEVVLYEEMARRGISGFGQSVHSICAHYLVNHGTDEQKAKFLPRMASGELIGAIAMTEPAAGSDLQGIRTRAVRDGDALRRQRLEDLHHQRLPRGARRRGREDGSRRRARRARRSSWSRRADLPGYRVGRVLDKIGLKAQDTAELFFEDVRVPAENLLGGEEGQGFYQLMSDLPYERAHHRGGRRGRHGGRARR